MEIIGQMFGKLKVLEKTSQKAKNNGECIYRCICDCGNICFVRGSNLKTKNTSSCGCIRKANPTKKRLSTIYRCMKQRCYNSKSQYYKNYGGRGIVICDEWLNNFENFYKWANNNGYQKNLTIDRINNDGNYEPSNCRWATKKEQANNMSTNRLITYNNKTKTLSQWAEELNFSQQKLKYRLDNWDIEKALTK